MTVATFDTLKFANTLKAAGIPAPQAEAEATALAEALSVNLKDLPTRDELKAEIQLALSPLRSDLVVLKWMCGAGLTMGTAILLRLFFSHGPI